MKKPLSLLLLLALAACQRPTATSPPPPADPVPSAIDGIREEATRDQTKGYPLPLVSTWNIGIFHYTWPNRPRGADPAWQIEQIRKGHRFLPTFAIPLADFNETKFAPYLYPPFEELKEMGLPFVLMGSQWERGLTDLEEYLNLPPEQNPNVITPSGEILKKVDPFGPTELWYAIGKTLTDHPTMARLQEIYPEPPRILFLSNNEHAKLRWHEAETSRRYLELYGKGRSDEHKRRVVGDAWIEKYRALQQGMRDGLKSETWRKNARFIAYGGDVSIGAMGRWGGWVNYTLHTPERFSLAPYMWDGVSPSYYMNNWGGESDHTIMSTQVQAMNGIFSTEEALRINPDFWHEISIWDGDEDNEKKNIKSRLRAYREAGQLYDLTRHRGWVEYGMWLTRPRAVRLYEGWIAPLVEFEDKFKNLMHITDRVHENPTLRNYWQHGRLLPNPKHEHPYQSAIPEEIKSQPRWFLPELSTTPPPPWKLDTDLPVLALVLELGKAPERSWLIYAHAPLNEQKAVRAEVPGGPAITIDVPREGVFYEVHEANGRFSKIEP